MNKLIDKITSSDYFLVPLLLILGIFNYGWVFYPKLGELWNAINGVVFLIIIVTAVLHGLGKYLFSK